MTPRTTQRPPGREPDDRLALAEPPATRQGTGTLAVSVRRTSATRRHPPLAPASVFAPVGRRKGWGYTYQCRTCGAYLFGRAPSLDKVTGERRASCGHRVCIMAARIYVQPAPGAVA